MPTIARAAAARLVQAILLPAGTVGYGAFVTRLVAYSRRTGVSATVLASLYTRYMQHRLGTRRDEPAARLVEAMPNVSPTGLRLTIAPTLAAHRLTGWVPAIYRYPYEGIPPLAHQTGARTTFYDQALERHLAEIEQLVVLGAGFDTRAHRLPPGSRVRCFEVDQPKTQAFKRETLAKAGVDASRITFVAADFDREDWFEKLLAAGFDPGKRSLFTWESVTMYLDRASVEGTLRRIAGTAPGTIVAFDYFAAEVIESRSPFWRYARTMIRLVGEPWTFGIDNTPPVRARVAGFLAACGLELVEQRDFGEETEKRRAPAGFATARVPATGTR